MTLMVEPRLVLKRMVAGGRVVEPGEVLDADGWRNLAVLERTRYVGPVPRPEVDLFAEDLSGVLGGKPEEPAPTKRNRQRSRKAI